jgi:single-strand DNA-binding protein
MSFNKIHLVGYLGRDPELRYAASGTAVCDFSVATSERRSGRAGAEASEVTTWFKISVFGQQAETVHLFLREGKLVFVDGRLSRRDWTEREGKTPVSLDVTASDVRFVGRRECDALGATADDVAGSY